MVAVLAVLAALSAGARNAPLPLGPPGLDERRVAHKVADGVTWTHITRRGNGGPFRVDVLEIDKARLLGVVTGHDRVPGLERPSAMARRHHAVAGVNGGYFAADGDPTGIVTVDRQRLSEPVGACTALVIGDDVRVRAIRDHTRVGERLLDGVNRTRGRIPACGGRGGDEPTQAVDPATICTDDSELVMLTPAFSGAIPSRGENVAVRDGVITHDATSIPEDGYLLTGSGDAARFLRRLDSAPQLHLGPSATTVLGGAPRLVEDGRVHVTAAKEGRGTDTGRNPRTIAGVRADGTVLLITIDGRQPGWSLGATLKEAARTARAMGATDALSLDSGGSTTMVVGGEVVSRPSEGERPVADGLFVL